MVHKTKMDENKRLWTFGFCSIVEEIKFSFQFCLAFYFHANIKKVYVKAQQINPTYESKKNFWLEREEEG